MIPLYVYVVGGVIIGCVAIMLIAQHIREKREEKWRKQKAKRMLSKT